MKRMFIFFGIIILLYSVYYDLNKGTLNLLTEKQSTVATSRPQEMKKENVESASLTAEPDVSQAYIEKEIKPGDTVLSLVEESLQGRLPVSIEEVVSDFEELNNTTAGKIQIGRTYKIPLYAD
ncbi:hypothetical protein [Rossellomorea aquimaris]|jgi:hypothetical protein|uniref:LysM domain-containing protein n=1 Tax=Rossellomorea aquimaris TaxID=189382 RepID=A0A1J6WQT1_9BACI|nr:hypothetical protein [Rossellomorea aquimaris]OIU70571.1 hypothetical protein BHE18_18795 [Rossellomorea aquimaris]